MDDYVDEILLARLCRIYREFPDYTDEQMKTLFFKTYGDQYSIEEYEKADKFILDAYSKDI